MAELASNADQQTQLQSELARVEEDIHKIENKLQNEGFMSRVPAAMIEKEQTKLARFTAEKTKILKQIAELD